MTLDDRLDHLRETGAWLNPHSEANLRYQFTQVHAYPERDIPSIQVDAHGYLYYDKTFRNTFKEHRQVNMDLVLPKDSPPS